MESRTRLLILAGLAALAILAYLPVLTQPFIADDYGNILMGRWYGPPSAWKDLASDPVQRYRPIFPVLTFWIERLFGPWPPAFYAVSIILHVLNTWLLFGLGVWRAIGWRISALAAAFFAIHEGHQEAVMWYSAAYELLAFFFGFLCLILWIIWLQSDRRRDWHYAAALCCFLLALFSKESAVVLVPLLGLPVLAQGYDRRTGWLGMIPFVAMGLAFAGWIFLGGIRHPRLDDGSFSLHAPVLLTWLNGFWRILWIWGFISLAALAVWRARRWGNLVLLAGFWIGVSLLPYSFLTYMTRVPSRHTYFASVGMAWLVAAGFIEAWGRFRESRRRAIAVVAVLVLAHNIGYLWIKKRAQYMERAAATEALAHLAQQVEGPIYVHRFPYPLIVAQGTVILRAGKGYDSVIWAPWGDGSSGLDDFLFSLDGKKPMDMSR